MYNVRESIEITQNNNCFDENDIQRRKLDLEADLYRCRAILEVSHALKRKALEYKRKARELGQLTTLHSAV